MNRFQTLYGVALTKKKKREIVLVLMALEAIFAFSYLGYIDFSMISSTTLHILVIVASMIFGIEGSVPVMCVFALTSIWLASFATATLDLLYSPIVSGVPIRSLMFVVARILFAIVASLIFGIYFRKPRKHIYIGIALLAMLNTFLYGTIMFVPYALFFPTIFHELILNWSALPVFRDWLSYVLAAAACCLVHYFLSKQKVKNFLAYLCENCEVEESKDYKRVFRYAKFGALIIGILCIMYLRKRILAELMSQGVAVTGTLDLNIANFLVQLLCALVCLFEIVSVIVRWINEYYTMQQVKMDEKLNEQSVKISIDPLTGVFSRFAYNDMMESYNNQAPEDFVAFLIDINGLKVVNDTLGHEAGDELICGAADCIMKAVGNKGRTFRIGGDEFVVFGTMKKEQADETLLEMNRIITSWSGEKVKSLSVSAGYALASEFTGYSIEDLTKEADKAMYEQKKEFYRRNKK